MTWDKFRFVSHTLSKIQKQASSLCTHRVGLRWRYYMGWSVVWHHHLARVSETLVDALSVPASHCPIDVCPQRLLGLLEELLQCSVFDSVGRNDRNRLVFPPLAQLASKLAHKLRLVIKRCPLEYSSFLYKTDKSQSLLHTKQSRLPQLLFCLNGTVLICVKKVSIF